MLYIEATEMALNNSDKEWVKAQIASRFAPLEQDISNLSERVGEQHRGLVQNLVKRTKELGAPVAFIALLATCFGVTLSALYQMFAHQEKEVEFRTRTDGRLSTIESQFVSLRALIAANQPNRRENQKAAKELVALATAKRSPAIERAVVVQAARSFLDASVADPSAWSVAIDFVNYQSTVLPWYPAVWKALNERSFPDCLSTKPIGKFASISRNGKQITLNPTSYEYCVLTLDDPRVTRSRFMTGLVVKNGLIKYRGGPVQVTGQFETCLFDLNSDEKPNPAVRLLADHILSTPNNVVAAL